MATEPAGATHSTLMLVEQTMVGAVVSRTVTVKLQLLLLPLASVALQVTAVVPRANVLPESGEQTKTGTVSQTSEAVVT